MNVKEFLVISEDWKPESESGDDYCADKLYCQLFSTSHFYKPFVSDVYEGIGRIIIDTLDITDDWNVMWGYAALQQIAHDECWEYYSIVEDTYAFEDGLLLIGYDDYTSYRNGGIECGHHCLNRKALLDGKVQFERDDDIEDLGTYCKKYGTWIKCDDGFRLTYFPYPGNHELVGYRHDKTKQITRQISTAIF
jgi:hypothetical protein